MLLRSGIFPRDRHLHRIVLLMLLASLLGCETTKRLKITPSSPGIPSGNTSTLSLEKSHRVTVELLTPTFSRQLDELPAFNISFQNRAAAAIVFSASNVSVLSGQQAVRAYTPNELVDRIWEESKNKADEYTGQQAEVFLQSASTRQDPSSAMAQLSAAKRANRAAEKRKSRPEQIREAASLIVSMQVRPGEIGGGVVKLHAEDILANEPLRVVISIDRETYEFVFSVGPR